MGKNKLKKFADMESFSCVLQYPRETVVSGEFPLKGKWSREFFKNDNPIVLELGCGKGEYTRTVTLPELTLLRSFRAPDRCRDTVSEDLPVIIRFRSLRTDSPSITTGIL